jgi:mRNA interferase RelE/StbE
LKTVFRASFGRDLKRIRSDRTLTGVRQAILNVETATNWSEIPNIKKIRGAENAFRIRVDDHRIGLFIENDLAEFVRVLSRRDIYRKFP